MIETLHLVHYSSRRIEKIFSESQATFPELGSMTKPEGFWVSVENFGDTWRDFCEAESYALHRLTHRHRIVLDDAANILHLSSCGDLDDFAERYGEKYTPAPFMGKIINWNAVARDYQGIIIAPYQWEKRMCNDSRWYHGWDCASGCIWDAEAISEIVLENVEEPLDVL